MLCVLLGISCLGSILLSPLPSQLLRPVFIVSLVGNVYACSLIPTCLARENHDNETRAKAKNNKRIPKQCYRPTSTGMRCFQSVHHVTPSRDEIGPSPVCRFSSRSSTLSCIRQADGVGLDGTRRGVVVTTMTHAAATGSPPAAAAVAGQRGDDHVEDDNDAINNGPVLFCC